MWVTASARHRRALAVGFGAFLVVSLALMVAYPAVETVPYHLIFIALTVVYGFALWSPRRILLVLALVTASTGLVLVYLDVSDTVDRQELSEVVLMPLIFVGMVWHSHRQLVAQQQVEVLAGRRQLLLEHERQFMQDAAHAIRTPITIARGHLELVTASVDDPGVEADLAVVLEQLDRMAHLSATLVALEEIESAQDQGRDAVDLVTTMSDLHDRWSKSVERTWHLSAPDHAVAMVDGYRVEMALEAMIDNAVKHTARWGRIRLSARCTPGWVSIGVEDDGPGVPLMEREAVFGRFVKGSSARAGQGSGLGLALVRAVAEAHGGTARIGQSWLGGAAFWIDLPALGSEADERTGADRDGEQPLPGPVDDNGITALS